LIHFTNEQFEGSIGAPIFEPWHHVFSDQPAETNLSSFTVGGYTAEYKGEGTVIHQSLSATII